MIYVILVLALLAVFHFIYECLVAPSLRDALRYRLFRDRDDLRCCYRRGGQEIGKDIYCLLELRLNNSIAMVAYIDFYLIYKFRKFIKVCDTETLERLMAAQVKIERSTNPYVKKINKAMRRTTVLALLVNTGGWLPFVIFLVPVLVILSWIMDLFIGPLTSLSETEMGTVSRSHRRRLAIP